MKKIRLKTKLIIIIATLVCSLLLAVALVFNLSVRGYISSLVNDGLDSYSSAVSDERRDEPHGKGSRRDKLGLEGNALVVSESGELLAVLHGDEETALLIADGYKDGTVKEGRSYSTLTTDGGTFAVTVSDDPVQDGAKLLTYLDVTPVTLLVSRVNTVLIIIITAAILLSVILSGSVARSLAKPIQELSDFARDIGTGKLDERSMEFREVELSGLADSMNLMTRELKESKRKQEVFFQNVSHELRTPLTSIKGNAEGIVYGVMEPTEAGKVIIRESDRLTGMVEDILYLSRMDKGLDTSASEPVDIRESLSACASVQRVEAESRGVRFTFDFTDEPVLLAIRDRDADMLFGNIISNAVRYAKSEIVIYCREDGERIEVRITDDGPGIPEKDLPHIFERFYKGEGGKHGIGLAIAKSVAEAYHGSLTARNLPGASFSVVFPNSGK